MLGLMQQHEMTVDEFLAHAEAWHGRTEVVSRLPSGNLERSSYAAVAQRARQISSALIGAGMRPGDRVATLASNTVRHLECWYGIVGIGCICHTLNPRMFSDQLAYIIDDAQDRLIFVEKQHLPLLAAIRHSLASVERIIVDATPGDSAQRADRLAGTETMESLLSSGVAPCCWGGFDEQLACGLCYTSGTTGQPKGVLYSHRSNYLHTLMSLQRDLLGLSVADVVLPIVPMFHANAWGLVYAAPAVGAKLVLPGSRLDSASLFELMESESVTFAAAVPSVWVAMLEYLRAGGRRLNTLKRIMVGGSAAPASLIEGFEKDYGVEVAHAWGMTELSPTGSVSVRSTQLTNLSRERQLAMRVKQGRCPVGLHFEIKDDEGRPVPHDGQTFGRLVVRGSTVAAGYYRQADLDILDEDGFFDTGDIATIDEYGYMQITDRARDLIKSGGEWISSAAIENVVLTHAKVALAAVIAIPHPKWQERPLLVVQLRSAQQAAKGELLGHLHGKVPRWWLPDDVILVEQMPLGATGKIDKKALREQCQHLGLSPPSPATDSTPSGST
jgi:fatty-acyl-CoA synthase